MQGSRLEVSIERDFSIVDKSTSSLEKEDTTKGAEHLLKFLISLYNSTTVLVSAIEKSLTLPLCRIDIGIFRTVTGTETSVELEIEFSWLWIFLAL